MAVAASATMVAACVDDGNDVAPGADELAAEPPDVTPDIVAPPTNLIVTGSTSSSTSLSWTGVTGATDYVILRGSASGTETQLTSNSPETATTYTDKHEPANTHFCFEIVALIGSQRSAPSNEVCSTTSGAPAVPTGVTASAQSSTTCLVSWTAVSGATQYIVSDRVGTSGNFNTAATVSAPTVRSVIAGLQPSTTYQFEVAAKENGLTSAESTPPATCTTPDAGLQAYYRFDDKTGTSAADSSGLGHTGTLASGAAFGSDVAPVVSSVNNGHNFSALTLPSSTAVASFPNVAVNFGTAGSVSTWVKVTAAPTGTLSIIGRRAANCGAITWLLGEDSSGLFFQGRNKISFGKSLTVGTWTQVAAVLSGSTLTLYINGAQVASTTYSIGTATTAAIQAGNVGACGNSGTAIVDETKLYSTALTAAQISALGTPPAAPTNLSLVSADSTHVNIEWNAVGSASDYFVYRGTASGNETYLTSNSTTKFDGDHLTPNETNSWEVYAVNSNGLISSPSNELITTTLGPPAAPATLTATLNTCCTPNRINLSWGSVARAVHYAVFQSTDGGQTFSHIGSTNAGTTTFTAGSLATKTTYTYEVESEDDANTFSAPSPQASATTN